MRLKGKRANNSYDYFLLNFSQFGVQEYVLISRSVLFMFIIQKLLYNFKTEIKKYKTLLLSVSYKTKTFEIHQWLKVYFKISVYDTTDGAMGFFI